MKVTLRTILKCNEVEQNTADLEKHLVKVKINSNFHLRWDKIPKKKKKKNFFKLKWVKVHNKSY